LQELLNHPAVQSGIAPFLIALVVALMLQRIKLSGLSIIAGFAITVYLASDFTFMPFTSTRKLVLCGLIGAALAIPLGMIQARFIKFLVPALGASAVIWVSYRIIQQQETMMILQWGAASAAYIAILTWGMDQLNNEPLRASSAATALGIGSGAAALVGASALLGQFGLAIGSAAVAHLLILMLTRLNPSIGRTYTFPVALIAGLTGCLAVLSAKLPWYALLFLASVPYAARWVPLHGHSRFYKGTQLLILVFALAGIAVYFTWRSAGDVPF